ncbi:glycoside hydrolase family 3 N-terminal domain-containing protein [Streptomyces chartreusis]
MSPFEHTSLGSTALPVDLDEAAHRCLVAGFEGATTVPDTLKELIDRGLGGVILFTRNIRDAEQVRRLTDELRAIRPDLVVAIDNEGGGMGHLGTVGAPQLPGSYALGVVDDPNLTARCADELAAHQAALGITASYAPVADLQHRPDNPIVRTRSFGADPESAARHLRAWITATEARGVASCAKHFPGHGGTVTDSHHGVAVDPRPYDELRADLEPFRAAVAAGVPMLMSAHVVYPALDPNRPATLSRRILGDLLRRDLGFDGVLVGDALEMKADCRDAVLDALRTGVLAPERVEEAAGRVRRLAARYATPPTATTVPAPVYEVAGVGLDAARRAVRIRGVPPAVRGAHVVDLFPPPHPVLNWGGEDLLTEVRAVDPTATGTAVTGECADPDDLVEGIVRRCGAAPLVVATCDAGLHPWQVRLRDALLGRRPDAMRVDTGLPEGGALHSYGRGRANLRAVAEVLAGV